MKVDVPLLRLPRQYCAMTLAAEVAALPNEAWLAHPGRIAGNDAVPLITPGGDVTNAFKGPMAPTEYLRQCPYILEIMTDLGAVWGRSRLMGLSPGAVVPEHVDVGHYWRTHLRIHIPVVTNPLVEFTCAGETVNMAAGECWIFDSFRIHDVRNRGTEKRIHLVLDTVGGGRLWNLMQDARRGTADTKEKRFVPPASITVGKLHYEHLNTPEVMSVWEVRCHVAFLLDQIADGQARRDVQAVLDRFLHYWGALWAQYGETSAGLSEYSSLLDNVRSDVRYAGASRLILPNNVPLDRALNELIFMAAVQAPRRPTAATG